MIKRLSKAKKNKQGAILVIVVLILALAMIFIASAMMLTQATRRRLYSETMKSQSRLTVTSASEVFLEALKTQEITDTQLEAIMNKTHGAGATKIKMVVPGVPGMSEAADNCTYLDIYNNSADPTRVYCDFTTIIGDKTENVQVVLKAEEEDPSFGAQFKNQVEVAGGVGIGELRFTEGVGMWDQSKLTTAPTDNNIVLRGSYKGQTSGTQYFSDVVFSQDSTDIMFGGGENFYGRVIFLQGSQLACRSGAIITGDVYLIGKDNSAGLATKKDKDGNVQTGLWDNFKTMEGMKNNKFIFSGRKVQNDTLDTNKKVEEGLTGASHSFYFVDKDGNKLDDDHDNLTGKATSGYTYTLSNSSLTATMKSSVTRYQGWNYSNTTNPFPAAADVFKSLCPDGRVGTSDGTTILSYDTYTPDGKTKFTHGSAIPSGKKYIINPVTTSYPSYRKDEHDDPQYTLNLSTETASRYLEPGYYYVTGNNTSVSGGGEAYRYDPIVFAIDGSCGSDYRFYFDGSKEFTLRGVVFAIYNANSDKPVLFILESGAKLQLSHNNDNFKDVTPAPTALCSAGFISLSNRTTAEGLDTAQKVIDYVGTKTWDYEKHSVTNTNFKDKDGNTVTSVYSKYYDNKVKPAMFIYGVGSNVFCVGKRVTIEAYIGLYGTSSFGPIDGSGDKQTIYGRIECQQICTFSNSSAFTEAGADHPVGEFCMPYCPQPTTDNSLPKQRIAKSKYSVEDITYYY